MKFSKLKWLIVWLQIIGGINGIGLIVYLMLQTEVISGPLLFIFLTGLFLFGFSIYCGRILMNNEKDGFIISGINQALQIFQFRMLGYGLSYSSGITVAFGIKGLTFNFETAFSSFNMNVNSGNDFLIRINLIPILVLIMLLRLGKTLVG